MGRVEYGNSRRQWSTGKVSRDDRWSVASSTPPTTLNDSREVLNVEIFQFSSFGIFISITVERWKLCLTNCPNKSRERCAAKSGKSLFFLYYLSQHHNAIISLPAGPPPYIAQLSAFSTQHISNCLTFHLACCRSRT